MKESKEYKINSKEVMLQYIIPKLLFFSHQVQLLTSFYIYLKLI